MYKNGLEFLKASIPKYHQEVSEQFITEIFRTERPEYYEPPGSPSRMTPDQSERTVERMLDMLAFLNDGRNQAWELINLLIGLRRTGESMENLTARLIEDIKAGALGRPETADS